jgi:hypothetical protein
MFRRCCTHATIVASRQPFWALKRAVTMRRRHLWDVRVPLLPRRAQPKSAHSDDCSPPRRCTGINSTDSSRIASDGAMRFAEASWSITRPAIEQTDARHGVQHQTCRSTIASFLCDVHILRAFPSRDDTTSVTFGASRFLQISHISR